MKFQKRERIILINLNNIFLNKMIEVNNISELQIVFTKYKYVVLKFSAEWCSPCKRIQPLFEKLSNDEKYNNIQFVNIDVDTCRDICDKYQIEGMPTFILIENETELYRFSGASENKLLDMLKKCN